MNIMTCSSSTRTIICQEVFDENSQPSEDEVLQYAKRIGINPETEGYLLTVARNGLMQALPPGWKPVYDDKLKRYYYFNFENGSARWDHPLDDYYKEIVRKKRSEGYCSTGEEDSKTSIKEDLKSYEEPVDISDKMHSSRSQENLRFGSIPNKRFGSPSGSLGAINVSAVTSKPPAGSLTGRPPLPPRRGRSAGRSVTPHAIRSPGSTSPLRHHSPSPVSADRRPRGLQLGPGTRDTGQPVLSPSTNRIDIDAMAPLTLSSDDRSPQEKLVRTPSTGIGLTLSGGGSMFLKSRQKTSTSTSPASVSPQTTSPGFAAEQGKGEKEPTIKKAFAEDEGDETDGDHYLNERADTADRLEVRDASFLSRRFENIHDDVESLQSIVDEAASKVESHTHSHSTPRDEHNVPQDVFPLKGILRDSSLCSSPTSRILWEMDPTQMTAEEKLELRNQELEEERKRSVRFADFEKLPLDIRFEMPESEESLTASSEEKENWDTDVDEHDADEDDRLNVADSVDTSPSNDNDMRKELPRRTELCMKPNVRNSLKGKFFDKEKEKTNWQELKERKEMESHLKDETELLNRLMRLKRKDQLENGNDNAFENEKTDDLIKKNVNFVDKIENNNYSTELKHDSWQSEDGSANRANRRRQSDPNRNSLRNKKEARVNDNDVNKMPDSEVKSIADVSPLDLGSGRYYASIANKTEKSKSDKNNARQNKTIKTTIDYLLQDIKTFSNSADIYDSSLNKNDIKFKRKDNLDLSGDDRYQNDVQNSSLTSTEDGNSDYRQHYLIDEEMYDKVGSDGEKSFQKFHHNFQKPATGGDNLNFTDDVDYDAKQLRRLRQSKNSNIINSNLLAKDGVNRKIVTRITDDDDEADGDDESGSNEDVIDNKQKATAKSNKGVKKINLLLVNDNRMHESLTDENLKSPDEKMESGNSISPLDTTSNELVFGSEERSNNYAGAKLEGKSSSNGSGSEEKIALGSDGSFEVKDNAIVQKVEALLEKFQGKLAKSVKEKISHLEKEQNDKLEAVKREFEKKETLEKQRLEEELNQKIELLKQEFKEQREKEETTMREITEITMEEFKKRLEDEREERMKTISDEQKEFLAKQEELSQAECKRVEDETNHRVQASVHILAKFVEEIKQREETELARLRSESDLKIDNIMKEYQAKQEEFAEKMKRETEVIEAELEEQLSQLKARSKMKLEEEERLTESARKEFVEKKEADWRRQQEELMNTSDEHRVRMEVLREECKQEEEVLRKKHADKVEMLTAQLNRTLEKDSIDITQMTRDFEKVRCEKRLLEDKYRTLKEKYIKLKSDIRLSLERKRQAKLNRKNREQSTTEDTDRSTSHSKTDPQLRSISPRKKYTSTDDEGGENMTPKTIKRRPNATGRQPQQSTVSPQSIEETKEPSTGSGDSQQLAKGEGCNLQKPKNVCDPSPLADRREGGIDTEISSADEYSFASLPQEKVRGSRSTLKQNWIKEDKINEENSSPLENLKKQLEKLDELEEQFPPSAHTDTYLRYPFSGPAGTSCELEFYRHRLHVERESVRRAKQTLTEQRHILESRQVQLKHKQASSTVQQLQQQEERELTDMEVHLHRTKALLGEKIIRLKHLELSLEQVAPTPAQSSPTNTLSEASHSSGFSGSEVDSNLFVKSGTLRQDRYWTDASFNVLQSLENINCEIREIWAILGKQQIPELGPPPLVHYMDLQHRVDLQHTDQYYVRTQTAEIADRTRGLRDWLSKARHLPTTH